MATQKQGPTPNQQRASEKKKRLREQRKQALAQEASDLGISAFELQCQRVQEGIAVREAGLAAGRGKGVTLSAPPRSYSVDQIRAAYGLRW